MKEKSAFFTGHRQIKEDILKISDDVFNIIEKLYNENGVKDFYAGGAIGFDTICAKCVLKLKEKFSDVKLHLILPYLYQDERFNNAQKSEYNYIKNMADEVQILSQFYYKNCMLIRNRALINSAKYCICYLRKSSGGTVYTVSHAIDEGAKIIKV